MAVLAELLNSPYVVQGAYVALLAVFISAFWQDLADEIPHFRIPVVGRTWYDLFNKKARARFTSGARELIREGFAKGADIFQVMGQKPLVVLHPKFIDEIKNHPSLSFEGATAKMFFENRIPGFEPFHQGNGNKVLVDMVRTKLTQSLGSLTIPLSQESADVAKEMFPHPTVRHASQTKTKPPMLIGNAEWVSYNFAAKIPYVVARVSTRAFLGREVARNEDWIDISVNYAINAFNAARELRQWPSILRPLVHNFLPSAQKLRKNLVLGRSIIDKELQRRELIRQGKLPQDESRQVDTLDWIDEISESLNRTVNVAHAQMALSLAAIHTTSNLFTNIMYDLAAHPELMQPLRDEIRAVVAEDGCLKKTSLLKLKLMDSVMKETQRLSPVSMVSLNRLALAEIPLSDGTVIPKGATLGVSAHVNHDESIYPDAGTYNGYRFYNKRQQPGNEQRFQFVTTTTESFGFGHGVHACPGRFFAANETKIFLIHLLLKYDWQLKEDRGRPANFEHGTEIITDPTVELLFRSREPEIDLAALGE
ncbi:hypothetical protein N7532_003199 [Penicillium argentinense]|uniref:Uncharacterized protein n=1 Tax=Penicillium argentinense TaxID=1131581 RepID=A0A9W9FM04_9EURO|nr:uncharacterized protein N7532_003199 [Penicillium argentinense]KAJ5102670.1 hypothetical protein N7532_003199 [Penicillium argentinense]